MKKIEVGAQDLKTRDGRDVRIYATGMPGRFPVHGSINDGDEWNVATWTDEGRCYSTVIRKDMPSDIILEDDPKPKLVLWAANSGYLLVLPENAAKPSGGYERVNLKDLAGWDE